MKMAETHESFETKKKQPTFQNSRANIIHTYRSLTVEVQVKDDEGILHPAVITDQTQTHVRVQMMDFHQEPFWTPADSPNLVLTRKGGQREGKNQMEMLPELDESTWMESEGNSGLQDALLAEDDGSSDEESEEDSMEESGVLDSVQHLEAMSLYDLVEHTSNSFAWDCGNGDSECFSPPSNLEDASIADLIENITSAYCLDSDGTPPLSSIEEPLQTNCTKTRLTPGTREGSASGRKWSFVTEE